MRVITLVISSDDIPQYKEMRDLATLYHRKMQDMYDYRFFFVELKEDISSDIEERGNYIYVKGKEHFHGMFDKIMKAIQFIHGKYEYDYILRTNLSSFWNLPKLFSMADTFPSPYAGGILMFNQFISGTGVFLSKDIAYKLSHCSNDSSLNDDVLISKYLTNITTLAHWDNAFMYYMIGGGTALPEDISNIIYFRIRNANRDIDIEIFRKLLKKLYEIEA
jgi:hypothetical protein